MPKIKFIAVMLQALLLTTSLYAAEKTCAAYIRKQAHKNHYLHLLAGIGSIVFLISLGQYLVNLEDAKILDAASLFITYDGTSKARKKAYKRVNKFFNYIKSTHNHTFSEVLNNLAKINQSGGTAYCNRIMQETYSENGRGLRHMYSSFKSE